MTSAETAAILAVDRKVTDGLNLVHEQLGVIRQERLEDRREFREFRNEVRQEFKAVREETRQELRAVHARIDKLEGAIRELSTQLGTLLERSRGTRRLVWGVLGTLGLLAAGGVLRPVFDRALAGLVGG